MTKSFSRSYSCDICSHDVPSIGGMFAGYETHPVAPVEFTLIDGASHHICKKCAEIIAKKWQESQKPPMPVSTENAVRAARYNLNALPFPVAIKILAELELLRPNDDPQSCGWQVIADGARRAEEAGLLVLLQKKINSIEGKP